MAAIWLTGLSGSGKSTLATALCRSLVAARQDSPLLLDGEAIRARLPQTYRHDMADRTAVLHHIVDIAAEAVAAGKVPIVATISHARWMRTLAHERLSPMLEVFVDCPAEVCAMRDVKGHYARAYAGRYACFIGVTHPYEAALPDDPGPDLRLNTATLTPDEALARLLDASLRHLGAVQA